MGPEQAEATLGTSYRQGPLQAATPDRKASRRLARAYARPVEQLAGCSRTLGAG